MTDYPTAGGRFLRTKEGELEVSAEAQKPKAKPAPKPKTADKKDDD